MQDAGRGLGGLEAATAQRTCHLLRLFRHYLRCLQSQSPNRSHLILQRKQ